MFGKLMNNYFYGKSGKGDFTEDDLPQTRMQLFWDMLKTRLSAIVRLNLLYMLAWIPVILIIGYHVFALYSTTMDMADIQMQYDAGTVALQEYTVGQSDYIDSVKAIVLHGLLFLIPAIAITGPFTAGASYITRNWARDEHAFLWSDFKDSVKSNWKQALTTSVITGFVPLIVYVCWMFYGDMTSTNGVFIVPQILTLMIGILWMMCIMYMYPMMVNYKLSYKDLLRNSVLLSIGRLPATVGLKLLSLVPVLITAIVSYSTPYFMWAMLICILYYIIIGYGLSRFVNASYTNAVFDKYINSNIEGAQINRGLSQDDDEVDDIEEDE